MSAAELNRAKKQTIAAVFSNLENHSIVAEDIGRQILTYGERRGPATLMCCRPCCAPPLLSSSCHCSHDCIVGVRHDAMKVAGSLRMWQSDSHLCNFSHQTTVQMLYAMLCRKEFKDFLDVVEGLTEKDITGLMQKLFKSPLTLATMGDVSKVPLYDTVAKRFS